jgi:hypothetical protein
MQGLAAALAADADPVLVQALAQPPEHPHAVSWAATPQVLTFGFRQQQEPSTHSINMHCWHALMS